MELKKVWMSPETEKKSHYGYRTVGGILGIVLLTTVLLVCGALLPLSLGMPQKWFKWFSTILGVSVTSFEIVLAARLGRRGMPGCRHFLSYRK